ncbi:MAG: hydrolase [Fusobacteriaceae bacterium]|jgi:nicotinamidase-related amidase|nr:hydrolase [Fusobacteriaceae bacterium]
MTKNNLISKKLHVEDAILIVIDMQEKLVNAMSDKSALVDTCKKLVKGSQILGIDVLYTQQYTKGLGMTLSSLIDTWSYDSSKNITIATENHSDFTFFEKTSFSIMGDTTFRKELESTQKKEIILCGVETHVCVLQSALDMVNLGYSVFLAEDAVSSRHNKDNDSALARMSASDVVITTVESILFELMSDATHPMFREISKLIK